MPEFSDLKAATTYLREVFEGIHDSEHKKKQYILLYAYNGTGKTRLSMEFKEMGKQRVQHRRVTTSGETRITEAGDERITEEIIADTLYFNAFTEDLFYWDNDLEGDTHRVLHLNTDSKFFSGLGELEMDNRIRPLLRRYADFDFTINTEDWKVSFNREQRLNDETSVISNIKISRGEENIFIWCFFLAIAQLALDGAEAYKWVKYIYVDDPISSLDEQNAIAVANHLAQILKAHHKDGKGWIKSLISSHHTLFFNVLCNELKKAERFFLSSKKSSESYVLRSTNDTPFFHHVAVLVELQTAAMSNRLYTYHFNMLRNVLEKTASFHGYNGFGACVKVDDNDIDGVLHTRILNILSHGNYSIYEPTEMLEENKNYFKTILSNFLSRFPFNPKLISEFEKAS